MQTISEKLFEEYCQRRGYVYERIAEKKGSKTADYLFGPSETKIVVEVAQLDWNRADKQFASDLEKRSSARYEVTAGKRLRDALEHAQEKFRPYKGSASPCLAVVYDNSAIRDHLDPTHDIDAAMFGEPREIFHLTADNEIHHTEHVRGDDKKLTRSRGLYFSALAILRKGHDMPPYMDYFHNPYATNAIRPDSLNAKGDRHFIKAATPDRCFTWTEYRK